jgi:hypothetical protein
MSRVPLSGTAGNATRRASRFQVFFTLLVLFTFATPLVAAEYRVVELSTNQAGPDAAARAISGSIAGNANVPNTHAVMWNDAAGPMIDLHPPGFNVSFAADIDGNRVVGAGGPEGRGPHALLWSGSAASVVDLNPDGSEYSEATGISGTQIVGRAGRLPSLHAVIWPDASRARVVDLHPDGYQNSMANATTGTGQGGSATPGGGGQFHPLLWSGTAASAVDLLPRGAVGGIVNGMAQDQQVGYANFATGFSPHAMLWTGTAASAVDLHPLAGFTQTTAEGTNGRQQVGFGLVSDGVTHALLWNGSNVVEDLHRFLPAGAVRSYASGIDDGGRIVGSAVFGSQARPVMWVPVPEPSVCALLLFPAAALLRRRAPAVAVHRSKSGSKQVARASHPRSLG